MSDKLPETNNAEEVDLGQLFNAIGRLFEKLARLISSFLKWGFKTAIICLKPIVENIKLISSVIIIAAVAGFVLEKLLTPTYFSQMLVQPHFQSKYKLADNVDYFNALIKAQNIKEISQIFEIDSLDAASLIEFEMKIGPETPNDVLVEYNDYVNSLDSVLASTVDYDEYVENRDILGGSVFSIQAKANKKDIFTKLETGFEKTFENPYSLKLKKIRDSTIVIQKQSYNKELRRLDSLQKIYLDVIQNESKNDNSASLGSAMFPMQLERIPTREYDLFQKELEIRQDLRELDEELIAESVFYDILAGFEEVGSKYSSFFTNYKILLPALSFLLLALFYIVDKSFRYIKSYEI
ncbi:hypothetical protein RM697_05275 [Ichthyenterobacterium sp. W332]|uniref:Uncharacterized protein n=1 Tax=Microcosmobacter mediterraneus TaxID=3075607 RepID=A0ABU2YK29_9FLAO|nr:hypothetical protein [Ichthyenterobacterium sp. W332]MDT0558044.1 hypothetical protein [Ichthyenterobacterium sp. W332]